ncbi:hypothetical protein F4819DRAFT_479140 [Hypoxylon fuscum]|nr:hypothetical protein F4819DRAFT_479140 [Hypoxylon fuscum]
MRLGSRQYHTKTRNGCGQCKKRRVRCNLEPPVCSNCRRRNETCDYSLDHPALSLPSTKQVVTVSSCMPTEPNGFKTSLGSIPWETVVALTVSHQNRITTQRAFSDVLLSFVEKTYTESTVSNTELATWIQELDQHIRRFNYLEPTVKSIQSLFQWLNGGESPSKSYALALQYNIEASNRFRVSNLRVTEKNWLAMLIFGIGIIIFHSCMAVSSSDEDFDFLSVFRILRESSRLGRQVGPYFLRSGLGEALTRRFTHDEPVSQEILDPLQLLETSEYLNGLPEKTKLIYHQTIASLKSWAVIVHGCPQTWKDFIYFPEIVSEAYLELLQKRDPFALLIFIHWCTIMHRAHRWFMDRWVRRAANFAMSYLGPEWAGSLEWPKTMLNSPPPNYPISRFPVMDHYSGLILLPFTRALWSNEAIEVLHPNLNNTR